MQTPIGKWKWNRWRVVPDGWAGPRGLMCKHNAGLKGEIWQEEITAMVRAYVLWLVIIPGVYMTNVYQGA